MRIPLSWLRTYVDLPASLTPREVADGLVRVGLEVEQVEEIVVDGPLVVGRVVELESETHTNGKTIRWCQVDVGEQAPRGIVCGAHNFAVGDLVVVALPGSVLPGRFAIARRTTYGHVSDGMICSVAELGTGEDRAGILVLDDPELVPGQDANPVLGLPEAVLDIAVTPDRGYALSVRGVAREAAAAFGADFSDPAVSVMAAAAGGAEPSRQPSAPVGAWPVELVDADGCDRFVTRVVRGVDPERSSPAWLRRRLHLAGMRSISLAVDITNHVMLDLGQPIHGYDADTIVGSLRVRRALAGETLVTLDEHVRELHPEDLVIADDTGAIGLAGVMGGASTEISPSTSDVVVEAAHFDPVTIARTARRHRLPSEASRRFERGVDHDVAPAAAQAVVDLLVDLGGGVVSPGETDVDRRADVEPILLPVDLPSRIGGLEVPEERVRRCLKTVGCEVEAVPPASAEAGAVLAVRPPSWRPDLTVPVELVEEVLRLVGYDAIPTTLPSGPASGAGRGRQFRRALRVTRSLAYAGGVEVRSFPFIGDADFQALCMDEDDPTRRAVRLVNPMSDQQPFLRTTLLPGLLTALRRNVGRGQSDVMLFEVGRVFLPGPDGVRAPRPPVDRRPTPDELAALDAHLPDQPFHVAAVACGRWLPDTWAGPGRAVTWADAVHWARLSGRSIDVPVQVQQDQRMPFHPGRCAAVVVAGEVVGWAGELHPRVVTAAGLPARSVAMELDLIRLAYYEEPFNRAVHPSAFPVAQQDVALVVDAKVPAAAVEQAVRQGAGPMLESVALFDVYTGEQVGPGRKSLAYTLRFRAPERTLTDEDVAALRASAVAAAQAAVGAELRGA